MSPPACLGVLSGSGAAATLGRTLSRTLDGYRGREMRTESGYMRQSLNAGPMRPAAAQNREALAGRSVPQVVLREQDGHYPGSFVCGHNTM
jgi:hypothetical protein